MAGGDMSGLVDLLAADVVVYGDSGGTRPSWPRPIMGRDNVRRLVANLSGQVRELGITLRRAEINGQPGAIFYDSSGLLVSVLCLDIADGVVQPALRRLAETDMVTGRVLDIGCGTGEHALMCAAMGLDATGIDATPVAIGRAKHAAQERGLAARFAVGDALGLAALDERFDTVIDSGLFHVFEDEDRSRYVHGLRTVIAAGGRYCMLCFGDRQPGDRGPRRVTQDEIRASFASGWRIESIEAASFELADGAALGWLSVIIRT